MILVVKVIALLIVVVAVLFIIGLIKVCVISTFIAICKEVVIML